MDTTTLTVVHTNHKKRLVESAACTSDPSIVTGVSLFSNAVVVFVTVEFVVARHEHMDRLDRRKFLGIFADAFLNSASLTVWTQALQGNTSSFVFTTNTPQEPAFVRHNALAQCTVALKTATDKMGTPHGRVYADVVVIDKAAKNDITNKEHTHTTTIVI